jgi:adenylate kinase family enzyme
LRRVAVFGNAGGGKSTLARQLAALTGLPLHVIDMMEFRVGGDAVPRDEYLRAHAEVLRQEAWIIDGFGGTQQAWERFAAADTLVYVDLPLVLHYWWVTKRLAKGLSGTPPGWPAGSPLWSSSLAAYRAVGSCERLLAPKYRQVVADAASKKRVHHLKSPAAIRDFLKTVEDSPRA